MNYEAVARLAVRLLAGEVIEVVDEQGRRWRGSARGLEVVAAEGGESAASLEGANAYDIAAELVALAAER